MTLKPIVALIGAAVSVAAISALYFTLGMHWILIVSVLCAMLTGYLLAAITASFSASEGVSEFMRGFLIGLSSAANAYGLLFIVALFAPTFVAAIVAAVLGIFTMLSVFKQVSQNGVYQGFIGYFNWLLPMSWLIVVLGFLLYFICLFLHAVTIGKVEYLKVHELGMDWKTGTFFVKGGLISNLNPIDTSFNMGNFAFVDSKRGGWETDKEHEAGHTLNLAVFGTIFHLIGALDENATPRGANAYSERIAQSNETGSSGNNIPMWS